MQETCWFCPGKTLVPNLRPSNCPMENGMKPYEKLEALNYLSTTLYGYYYPHNCRQHTPLRIIFLKNNLLFCPCFILVWIIWHQHICWWYLVISNDIPVKHYFLMAASYKNWLFFSGQVNNLSRARAELLPGQQLHRWADMTSNGNIIITTTRGPPSLCYVCWLK